MSGRGKRRSPGIGTKVLVSHLSLSVSIILLAALLSYAMTSQYMKETWMEDLLEKAGRIADSSRQMTEGDFVPSRRVMHTYSYLTDAKVFFLDAGTESIRMSRFEAPPDREPPADAPSGEDNLDFHWVDVRDSIDREFAARVLAGERVTAMRHFEFAQGEIIFAGAPILDEAGAVRGGVILAQPVEELRSLSRVLRYMLTVVMSVSMLMAVVLAMQLTRVLVRPIQRITDAARRMENGVYAERITRLPNDEIGDLGHALNSMSGRLVDVIRSIRKERDKLEMVISGMSEGLVAVDSQWNIVHANAAFFELTEMDSAVRLMDGNDRYRPLAELLSRCLTGGEAETLEWINPSHRVIQVTVSARRDENGAISGTVGLLRDVSEQQRIEQLRRDYAANVSHELRTPLTGIRGMVEPLIDGCYETEEERLESYRIILKETIRLEKLVGEMLEMSRLQDGRVNLELELLELPGILEAAARGMRSIAEEAGVRLSVETDGTSLSCMGNEDRITQVLVILIDNALSFTGRGGSVTVFACDDGNRVRLGVRDTGCGIDPRDLPLIFERFYKVDRSRMRTTGTGLGLSIARLVVRLMGGDISVKSQVGAGSEFSFTLNKQATETEH